MIDKNLTDSEIVKDLKDKIEFENFDENGYAVVDIEKLKNILDLINRLQAENEKLQKALENQQKISMDRHFEIERLKKVIENYSELEQGNLVTGYKNIKAEAYKECIEKVKETSKYETYCDNKLPAPIITYHITKDNLDNLLKEFERKENTTYDD